MAKALDDTERRGISPERVAADDRAGADRARLRARYLVGRDARGMVVAHALLPDPAFDRVLRRVLGV